MFNLVAADNDFEREFPHYLQEAADLRPFAKCPTRFGFTIEYRESATNTRYYEPDFVAVDNDDVHYVIETKRQQNIDGAFKGRAATIWGEDPTLLTDVPWCYVQIPQVEFGKLQPTVGSDTGAVFSAGGYVTP